MIWIFASVVLILAVAHKGFRKVLAWLAGGAVAAYLVTAGILHLQEVQTVADERAAIEATHVAWVKAEPEGCFKYEKVADRGQAFLDSGGNCGGDLPNK